MSKVWIIRVASQKLIVLGLIELRFASLAVALAPLEIKNFNYFDMESWRKKVYRSKTKEEGVQVQGLVSVLLVLDEVGIPPT